MKLLFRLFFFSLLLCLTSCGGGSSPVPVPVVPVKTIPVLVHANLGAVSNGTINAYTVDSYANIVILAGSGITDFYGNTTINLSLTPLYNGPVLFSLVSTPTANYLNELDGQITPLPLALPATKIFRSLLPSVAALPQIPIIVITPISEIVVYAAKAHMLEGVSSATAIEIAVAQVGDSFLSGANPLRTIPDNIMFAPTGDPYSSKYASLLAAMSLSSANADLYTTTSNYAASLFPAGGTFGLMTPTDINILIALAKGYIPATTTIFAPPVSATPTGQMNVGLMNGTWVTTGTENLSPTCNLGGPATPYNNNFIMRQTGQVINISDSNGNIFSTNIATNIPRTTSWTRTYPRFGGTFTENALISLTGYNRGQFNASWTFTSAVGATCTGSIAGTTLRR
ncbi:MAG: hypothetical protein Q9M28_09825 [Mariprofundaceae bacterium]|nr:hypothetical protein [Mariprofundaceae bacterium]